MMTSEISTLLLLAAVVALVTLASYLFHLWRARHGGGTVAIAGLGIGAGLLLAAALLLVFGIVLIVQQWLSRLDATTPESEGAMLEIPNSPNPFDRVSGEPSPERSRPVAARERARSRPDENPSHDSRQATSASEVGVAAEDLIAEKPADRQHGADVPSASDPWATTRCVVPVRREWDDGTRWTIVNDCGVAVAILIAVCARSESDCPSRAWRYPEDGLTLPPKYRRSVTEAEQTQYVNGLRHAACVVTDPTAVELIALDREARNTPDRQRAFEEARLRDACLSEVRKFSLLGAASGMPIETVLGATLYSSVEQ